MKKLNYNTRVIINYAIMAVLFVLLSLIALIFNEWVFIICSLICAVCGLFVTMLLVSSDPEDLKEGNRTKLLVSTILRYAIMAIGLVGAALLVRFTMVNDDIENRRYIMVAVAALPYFFPTISLMFTKMDKE